MALLTSDMHMLQCKVRGMKMMKSKEFENETSIEERGGGREYGDSL